MDDVFTKRDYVRTNNFTVSAKISEDGKIWHEVKVPNIAAGGLLILTDRDYAPSDVLWFDLKIDPRLAIIVPITLKIKGVVKVDRGIYDDKRMYAIVFTDISLSDQIRLDELVHMAAHKYGDN
ncbi:MAG: PilZ domain-containing protein [Lachnospiraceae bacterium]|nr:PilZ domain-containing protein [Lachnospiraceae bacterium]